MAKHRITAVRLDQKGDSYSLVGLTQSPRGTRTIADVVKFKSDPKDRAKRQKDIAAAVAKLLESDE